jgi:membrane-associated PAP2 superfamily phosphatase
MTASSQFHSQFSTQPGKSDVLVLFASLAALLLWDYSGLDWRLIQQFGTRSGFAWRDHWFTFNVLHNGGRYLAILVFLWMLLSLLLPTGIATALSQRERLWWVITTVICASVVPVVKAKSLTSCPWSLSEFGGVAKYVSHWSFGQADSGGGHCFPSGHASNAFAFLPGWFVLRGVSARAARGWLIALLLVGALFGLAQMMRGAHYASHTMWTAWICLLISLLSWHGFKAWRQA